MNKIVTITDKDKKSKIARQILEGLKEWFEVDESREKYIAECKEWLFFASEVEDGYNGFLCLKPTGDATVELAVMGVSKSSHRSGVGRDLVEASKKAASDEGYEFMQVKTVKMGMYEDYDITNKFYISCGFKEFELFPTYWDEANPCQIYVMSLR